MMDYAVISNIIMILIFILGYFFITIEHSSKLNKSSIALIMAILSWAVLFVGHANEHKHQLTALGEHMFNISQVVFFLLGALAIVETINAHKGFSIISNAIRFRSKVQLLWALGFLTFFLSAILDNLTTTIIMVMLIQKIIEKKEDRLLLGGAIVIAANAGGAWTPIGDVTTTMLWIGGQLTTFAIIKSLFLPSLFCLITTLICLSFSLRGNCVYQSSPPENEKTEPMSKAVLILGIGCLLFVPVFKMATGLPPFMGMLLGMAVMWLFTDMIHRNQEGRSHLQMPEIMSKIDITSVLFFLGILLCIDALDTAGILRQSASWLSDHVNHPHSIAVAIGLISAVVDNVPLVAAAMGMYEINQYPVDCSFWRLIAYCAGTGGSILVIGSAAGVAFMGLEKVEFFWYLKKIGVPALMGYFVGIGVYQLFIL